MACSSCVECLRDRGSSCTRPRRLDSGHYKGADGSTEHARFADDMRQVLKTLMGAQPFVSPSPLMALVLLPSLPQVFMNCTTFYGSQAPISKVAKTMQRKFENEYADRVTNRGANQTGELPGDAELERSADSASGFKGVYKCGQKWEARYLDEHIGYYWSAIVAARVRYLHIAKLEQMDGRMSEQALKDVKLSQRELDKAEEGADSEAATPQQAPDAPKASPIEVPQPTENSLYADTD